MPEAAVSVFIPVYNEAPIIEESLRRLLPYLEQRVPQFEVLIVDNGSTDTTVRLCTDFSAKDPRVRCMSIPGKGPGRALKAALPAATYPWIITLDADLSSDLLFIDYAIDLGKYADMVIGSKTMGKQRRSLLRLLGSQSYLLCAQLIFNMTLSDYSIGCKAFRRDPVLRVVESLDPWTGYILEIALYFTQAHRRVIQVGIDCDDNRESRFNLVHEGLYRFRHLKRARALLRNPASWLRRAAEELQKDPE